MLKEIIQDAIKTAMKVKETQKVKTLRLLISSIQQIEIDSRQPITTDDKVYTIINKMIKQRNESIVQYIKGNRLDLVKIEQDEIDILTPYLPQQLTENEIDNAIQLVFDKLQPKTQKDMGLIINELKSVIGGSADMSLVAKKVKAKLSLFSSLVTSLKKVKDYIEGKPNNCRVTIIKKDTELDILKGYFDLFGIEFPVFFNKDDNVPSWLFHCNVPVEYFKFGIDVRIDYVTDTKQFKDYELHIREDIKAIKGNCFIDIKPKEKEVENMAVTGNHIIFHVYSFVPFVHGNFENLTFTITDAKESS